MVVVGDGGHEAGVDDIESVEIGLLVKGGVALVDVESVGCVVVADVEVEIAIVVDV